LIPRHGRRLVAFLGGTIGNLDRAQRSRFLFDIDAMLDPDERFLLGTDIVKDPARLLAAYSDSAGVTAAFNRNALVVMNKELGADFEPDAYDHVAHWDEGAAWIEMRLVARRRQHIHVAALDLELVIDEGEWIRTEISAKFTPDGIREELWQAGLVVEEQWTDDGGDFLLSLARPYCGSDPTNHWRDVPTGRGANTFRSNRRPTTDRIVAGDSNDRTVGLPATQGAR
jgi:L-histidine N-alpha-methyltransferase